jgi:hypothetical protein
VSEGFNKFYKEVRKQHIILNLTRTNFFISKMSTRARAARTSAVVKSHKQQEDHGDMDMDVDGAHKANITNAKAKSLLSAANGRRTGKEETVLEWDLESVDCICSKGNDGSPMILCSECRIWCVIYLSLLLFTVFR